MRSPELQSQTTGDSILEEEVEAYVDTVVSHSLTITAQRLEVYRQETLSVS